MDFANKLARKNAFFVNEGESLRDAGGWLKVQFSRVFCPKPDYTGENFFFPRGLATTRKGGWKTLRRAKKPLQNVQTPLSHGIWDPNV